MLNRKNSLILATNWIRKNLIVTSHGHMTPEIKLRLLTSECPMWMAQPDQCPFNDPYWAVYWPGGQALTRFIIDNPSIVRGKSVLDFGCGCGASAIAAKLSGAKHVVANDIDPDNYLPIPAALNGKLNKLARKDFDYESQNLLSTTAMTAVASARNWDVVLVGDCCYDSEFSSQLLSWLKGLLTKDSSSAPVIIIGDPGRHALSNIDRTFKLDQLHCYALPEHMSKEHYGLTTANIHRLVL